MASAFRCRNKKQAPRCGAGHVCHPGRGDTFLRPKDANRAAGAKQPRPKDAEFFVTRRVTPFCARRAQAVPEARETSAIAPQCRVSCATATVAPRAFVLASSISLAPPQAAGLVHFAARPLQTANASLVCCLVPFLSCQKKVCKKEAQENEIALTRRKTSRYILRIIVTLVVKERPSGDRQIGFPERTIHCANRYVSAR